MGESTKQRVFTMEELQIAEKIYREKRQVRSLIMGQWQYRDLTRGQPIDGTRAEVVNYRDHHTFCEFLKERCKNG